MLFYLLGCAGFTAGGIWMIREGDLWGWWPATFFALGVVVFLIQLLPGSSFLTVSHEGIEFCAMFRRTRILWSEISEIGTYTLRHQGMPAGTFVGLNFVPEYPRYARGRALAKKMVGFEGALPDTYGFRAEELARVLSECQAEWGRRQAPPGQMLRTGSSGVNDEIGAMAPDVSPGRRL